MMVSKKRKGNDPEEIAALEREARGGLGPGGKRGDELRLREQSKAYQAGRRAMAYELVQSGGLSEGRLGLEILYLLPDDFVIFYEQLFHKALGVGDNSVMHGRSGGLEKAAGRTSMQLGTDERGPQAQSSGKRWKKTAMTVMDDDALKIKEGVDKGLRELAKDARIAWAKANTQRKASRSGDDGASAENDGASPPSPLSPDAHVSPVRNAQCQGMLAVMVPGGGGGSTGQRPCRRFLKASWEFCPSCGTAATPR